MPSWAPTLVGPAGALAVAAGLPALAGAYLIPILLVGPAAILTFVRLRPDPYELADTSDTDEDELTPGTTSLEWLFRRPHVPVAMVALIVGQMVMTLVMTMTPLHMSEHGHDLGAIGVVISAHVLGMYALSPISGRLTDRFGSQLVILCGLAILGGSAVLSAVAPPEGGALLLIALFLLGFGWSLGYVAGSALLTTGLSLPERTRLQGLTDALIWSSAAGASLASGLVVATAGYTTLGLLGAALVVFPAWLGPSPSCGDPGHRRLIRATSAWRSAQSRRIGRVMQVGPPEPLMPISLAGYAWTSQPVAAREAAIAGLPSARMTTPGRTASTLQPSVGNSSSGTSMSRIPSSCRSSQSPTGRSGR